MRSGEVKRRYWAARQLALSRLLLQLGVFGQRLRTHVGWEQLRMALFQAEVRGAVIAEKDVAVADEKLVDAEHRGFSSRGVANNIGIGHGGAKAVRLKKRGDPFESPLQWAHDAVFVARA